MNKVKKKLPQDRLLKDERSLFKSVLGFSSVSSLAGRGMRCFLVSDRDFQGEVMRVTGARRQFGLGRRPVTLFSRQAAVQTARFMRVTSPECLSWEAHNYEGNLQKNCGLP